MREGALLWNKAFEAAGFRNAVQVKDPTPDMDPMDIRYAWILWINRDERGFSSGGTYRDPRTGEILGSKTRMDSHRIRTIGNYWESYSPTTDAATTARCSCRCRTICCSMTTQPSAMPAAERDMVLLRQQLLTAHELGHVMGFGHNFASSLNNRASVMEYPTPRVKVVGTQLDLSEAFNGATGEYDAFMARYAYTEFPPEKEKEGLEAIIKEMRAKGILYVPSTDPRWSWYDDRATPTEYLRETMAARKIMLDRYGPGILKTGDPIGDLRDMRLWMTYLHHRWAIEAGIRYIGGHVPEHRRQGRRDAAHRDRAGGDAARSARPAVVGGRTGESRRCRNRCSCSSRRTPGNNLEDLSSDCRVRSSEGRAHPVGAGARAAARGRPRGAAGDVRRSADRRARRCPRWCRRC